MSRGMSRAERLREMERLYLDRGWTDIEMAERVRVSREQAFKDRRLLETEYPFVEVERGRWKIDRMRYLSSIKLNLHEALALYLPARRAARQTLIAQPHVANGLEKLATALKQPMTEQLVKAANMILAQMAQPERVAIIETVTRGWIERRKIRIAYRGLRARHTGYHIVCPYLIEPALWSDGAYVIGHSDYFDDIAVFKIERIESAELEPGGNFEIPQHFDEQRMLRYAWGIWSSEGEPEWVKLRFLPGDATRRVKETIWHPYQKPITDTPDGGCIWEALVAEPREMIPWVRGWGADVEVLEPPELREALAREAGRLAAQYQVVAPTETPAHRLLWAKSNKRDQIHRLLYHMIDVGQVALALWKDALSDGVKRQMTEAVGLNAEQAGWLFAFWASLHDLGKASPAFQDHPRWSSRRKDELRRDLEQTGLTFKRDASHIVERHELISTWALKTHNKTTGLLTEETGLDQRFAGRVAVALGGHHGAWPSAGDLDQVPSDQKGISEAWRAVRSDLVRELKRVFQPLENLSPKLDASGENRFITLLSALTSIADWLGSNEDFFPLKSSDMDMIDYAELSAGRAAHAVRASGWLMKPVLAGLVSFCEAFRRDAPHPIQAQAIEATQSLNPPALVILEAPTGIGKTEIALYLTDRWIQASAHGGLYIAMPTTATSNQMHARAKKFLQWRYGDVRTLLVHSRAELRDEQVEDETGTVEDQEGDRVNALEWFLPRKRSLLVPFGVGTVDQALMSVLQIDHFFTRLFGLSGKVVIFDEVHAYDTYMATLFKRLLAWLRQLGVSVIMLSATLPDRARRAFASAYLGHDDDDEDTPDLPADDYPRLTCVPANGEVFTVSLPQPDDKPLSLEWIGREPAQIAERLGLELGRESAGCVCAAVVCNRVDRALEVYDALRATFSEHECEIILFHARTPFIWRERTEQDVLARFGPPDNQDTRRPRRAIVVATQVIEQSLDLDFDVMISDLAPIDLLIQRVGRLHRHTREYARPPYRLLIAQPETDEGGLPNFSKDVYVYNRSTLLSTWFVLRGRDALALPSQLTDLIEQVYGELPIPNLASSERATLADAERMLRREVEKQVRDASEKMVLGPDDRDFVEYSRAGLQEDDTTIHAAFQALTRKDEPGLQVVCLHETLNGCAVDPDGRATQVNPYTPTSEQARAMLKGVVSIRHRDLMTRLLAKGDAAYPPAWKRIAALRYHRLMIFHNGQYEDEGLPFTVRLTPERGLQFIPKEGAPIDIYDED